MASETISERRNQIAKILLRDGSIRVNETAERFSVSTETIRKDIIYLEQQGLAKKSHGGALAVSEVMVRHISSRLDENTHIKNKIAEKALGFIPDKGVVYIDAGSTTLALAKLMQIKSGLTIITNSVMVANILAESDNKIYLTGGEFRGNTMALVGLWTNSAINSIRPNIAFMGSSGTKDYNGPCSETFVDAEVKKNIVGRCDQVVVLMDSTKFSQKALVEYALWSDVDCLITDKSIEKQLYNNIALQTQVITV